MKTTTFDILFQSMSVKKPVLLLGAGFSYGVFDSQGKSLPMGKGLSKRLFDFFYAEGELAKKTEQSVLDHITAEKENLKSISYYLRLQNKVNERNRVLSNIYKNCSPDDFHKKIINYPWEYIFTLNIDDLVENIFKSAGMPLSVWDFSHASGNNTLAKTRLLKLHGSVNDESAGYVFDEYEYQEYMAESSSMLKEFAHQTLQNDLVLVGTEFQEDDLNIILKIYEKSGYSGDAFKRYFISPSISPKLMLQIESSESNIWIQKDAKSFFEELEANIVIPTGKKEALQEKGVTFLDEVNRQAPTSLSIYKGDDVRFADIFHNNDILSCNMDEWIEKASSAEKSTILSFYGDSYIGKTCFAKRLLVELFYKGFVACHINRLDDAVYDGLVEYLKILPDKTRFVFFVDNAAYEYKRIAEIIQICPMNISKIVAITEDTLENHMSKSYVIIDQPGYCDYKISAEMNDYYAKSIFDKLVIKNRLGFYLKLLPPHTNPFSRKSRDIVLPKIAAENDIIDALYVSSEGVSFQKHYRRWLDRQASEPEKKMLNKLCYLNRLGVTRIPNTLLSRLGNMIPNFSVDNFCKKYSEIISTQYGWSRMRRGRILNQLLENTDYNLAVQALKETAKYCVPRNEGQKDEIATIFEKTLRVKRIRNSNLLLRENIITMFSDLEEECGHLSYFWVQYGIAAQINGNYEDANNHLMYAHVMKPSSYHVAHALAKNNMEWGLKLIESGMIEGKAKFLDGSDKIYDIICNPYRDFFRYAVHTYINMWLRYAELTGENLTTPHCELIVVQLKAMLAGPIDNMIKGVTRKFVDYCKKAGLSSCCSEINTISRRFESTRVQEEEYDID